MDEHFLLIALAGLAIMIAASVFSRRTGVAAPLLLAGLGIAASYLPGTPVIEVAPELILAGVLPPLLFSSAVNLPLIDVRRNLSMIAWLSVVMVIASALAIGGLVHWLFPAIPFGLATALGAVVSPTDAVAATAIGRRVGLPPRLMAVLEGESLVNDASALVVLRTAIAALSTGGTVSLVHTTLEFLWAVAGALLVGWLIGWGSVALRHRLDDPVLNTTISFAVPFLAYFPAEEIGASGVLGVVAAGLVSGALGSQRLSAGDRQTQAVTWSTVNFIAESGVFLAMGYQLPQLVDDARTQTSAAEIALLVLVVVALLVLLRFAGLAWPIVQNLISGRTDSGRNVGEEQRARLDQFEEKLDAMEPAGAREENRLVWARRRLARGRADLDFEEREPISARGLVVIGWAGMRGVVTVAAAQTIPGGTPHRETVVLVAFLVALITLVLFGLTLPAVIRRMRLESISPVEKRDSMTALLRRVGELASDALGPLEEQAIDGERLDPALVEQLKERVLPRVLAAVRQPEEESAVRDQSMIIQRRYLDAMREALTMERTIGAYSSETFREVEALLDSMEQRFR